jgi:hypothetical protein
MADPYTHWLAYSTMRALWAVILNMIAVILYGAGLLSPLTPSEGIPNMGEIFVFAIIPVVFLGVSGFWREAGEREL